MSWSGPVELPVASKEEDGLDAMAKRTVRITHQPSGVVIAEGPIGWGITPFEGNYYILYVWLGLHLPNGERSHSLEWLYLLPNPLFPFIWYRVAVARNHPELAVEEV